MTKRRSRKAVGPSIFTRAVHGGEDHFKYADAITTPIVQTSTFVFKSTDEIKQYTSKKLARYEYGRYGNPTQRAAEVLLEQLRPRSGGFSAAKGRPPAACFTAEVCAAMARFGFAHHPRVREAVAWLVERDGGAGLWSCPELRHLVGGACPIADRSISR